MSDQLSDEKPMWLRILPCLLTPAVLLVFMVAAVLFATMAKSATPEVRNVSALSGKCRLMFVDTVQFQDGGRRGWYLYIGGLRRFGNMDVSLDHRSFSRGVLTVDVVGCTGNIIALPIQTPFTIELPLRDFPKVRQIRVVGSNGTTLHKLPGR